MGRRHDTFTDTQSMQYISRKELLETDGVTVFTYNLNKRAIKMFEFGAVCLLIIAALIYPMTHFDPPQWKVAPVALGIASTVAYFTAQKWRAYVKKEYVGWDATNLYITQGSKGVAVVPGKKLTLDNSGLKDQFTGSVIYIHLENEPVVPLRLVAGFVILSKFRDVLATILTHIKQNMIESGEIAPKCEQADATGEVKAEQSAARDEVEAEQADA